MLAFSTSLGLAFVILCGLMFFLIVVYNWPQAFDEEDADLNYYMIQDYDGVWFKCSREEWLAEKRKNEGDEPFVRRTKLLPAQCL